MDERTSILVRVLATTDAVWLPIRRWGGPVATNLHFARKDYAAAGVLLRIGGDAAARRAGAETIERLAAEGELLLARRGRIRGWYVRLAEDAEARTRDLCGLAGLDTAFVLLAEVARLSKRDPKLLTDLWIDEMVLAVVRDQVGRLIVEQMAVAGLARGWLESNATRRGQAYYAVTQRGWDVLDGPPPPPPPIVKPSIPSQQLYDAELLAELDRLATQSPANPREIGYLPLSCSMGGEALPCRTEG